MLRGFRCRPALEQGARGAGDPEEIAIAGRIAGAAREGAARMVGRHELLEIPENTPPVLHGGSRSIAQWEVLGNVSDS